MFAVFTADIVLKKGAPPRSKQKKRKVSMFTVFSADMVEDKRGDSPLKTVKINKNTKKIKTRVLPGLPRIW